MMRVFKKNSKFKKAMLGGLCIGLVACSDESQVNEQQNAPEAGDVERTSKEDDCESKTGLRLADDDTFYGPTVKGVLNGCAGCHIGGSPPGGIVLNDYDPMVSSFAQARKSLFRIVEQVQSDHQGSKGDEPIMLTWANNNFARGTPTGDVDESPFFEYEDNGDSWLKFEDEEFDPFAQESGREVDISGSKKCN